MSFFIKYKLKDGRKIRGKYRYDTDKVLISRDDFEELLNEVDVAYEQAKQLQTIIENLQNIKAEAVRKAFNKIRTHIKQYESTIDRAISDDELKIEGMKVAYTDCIRIIDEYQLESGDNE